MRRRPSHRLFPWLCCLFLQLGCQSGGPPPTLSGFHGCDDLRHEPGATRDDSGTYVCAVAEKPGPLRLWVQAAGPAGVALARRGAGLRGPFGLTAQLTADDRLLIEGDRAALPQVLTVTGRSVLGGAARGPAVHLRVVRQELLSVEVMADAARDQNAIAQGIADLRAAAETPPYRTDPVARARLLHRLADLELTAAQHSDAVQHFEQALALAEPAGLVSVIANAARLMAFEHYTLSRDIPRALAILEKYAAAIHLIELEAVLELGHRGLYAQERGDLSAALRYLATALAAIKDMGEDDSRRGIAVMYTVLLAQQGLTQKAEAEIHKLRTEAERPDGAFAVCERMRLLGNLGWARILMQESHSPGAQDPIPLLARALFYRAHDHCAADGRNVEMNWAHAELLVAERLAEKSSSSGMAGELTATVSVHLQAAQEHLGVATRDEVDPPPARQLDAAELRGRIAHLGSRFDEAADQFAQLAALARRAEEPDYQARALLGQALVSAARARTAVGADADHHTQAARAAFEQAEVQLDARLGQVPLSAARRAFLPRFAAGTAAFVEFLIEHGELRQALEVARRAQVRGLVATLAFDTLSLLPESQRQRLMQERDEFVRQSSRAGNTPALGQQFETLLSHLRAAGLGQMPLRPLQPGEAMHLCHPLPHGELACFVADQQELQVARLPTDALQRATNPAEQATLLLAPFARQLNRARVLRVLPSQPLREVNFPALPWPGDSGYLSSGERLVVYALDLDLGARPSVPPTVRGQALMLTNLNLQHAQKSAPGLFDRLRQLGWQVTPYSNQRFDHGFNVRRRLRCWLGLGPCAAVLPLPVETQPGTASALRQALPQVELAQLDTHARYNLESGWQSELEMPDQSLLSVFDLLTLARAPRWTVLLVCEGGLAGQGADADDISLAQALLLRGGEAVVASTRPLEDELSGRWSQALYGTKDSATGHLSAAAPSLPEAFRAAQVTLRNSNTPPRDWTALRLFVP